MSFISVNFSTLFYKRNRKLSPTLKLRNTYFTTVILCTACVFFKLSLFFFRLQAALITNALIPTSIFVSYYWMSSSDSKKGEIEISLIVVGAPKLSEKEDDVDFQVFWSEIWKFSNNQQMADYALTIGQLLKNWRLSAN